MKIGIPKTTSELRSKRNPGKHEGLLAPTSKKLLMMM